MQDAHLIHLSAIGPDTQFDYNPNMTAPAGRSVFCLIDFTGIRIENCFLPR
jgi:hypothetical protein